MRHSGIDFDPNSHFFKIHFENQKWSEFLVFQSFQETLCSRNALPMKITHCQIFKNWHIKLFATKQFISQAYIESFM